MLNAVCTAQFYFLNIFNIFSEGVKTFSRDILDIFILHINFDWVKARFLSGFTR